MRGTPALEVVDAALEYLALAERIDLVVQPGPVVAPVPGAGHLIPVERPGVFVELAAELLARADRAE